MQGTGGIRLLTPQLTVSPIHTQQHAQHTPDKLPYASQLSCVGARARGGSRLLGSTLLKPRDTPG